MTSVDDVTVVIRAALAEVDSSCRHIITAKSHNDSANGRLHRVTNSTVSPRPQLASSQLQAAAKHLSAAERQIRACATAIEDYITTVLGSARPSPPSPSATQPHAPARPTTDHSAGLPVWGAPSRNGVSDRRTHGRWHDGSGDMERFTSGMKGPYAHFSRMMWERGIWGGDPPPSDAWTHSELKFATFMRARGKQNETITINNPHGPCPDCDQLTSFYLKEGTTLTIRWPGGERTFVGRQEHERDNEALLRQLKMRKRR